MKMLIQKMLGASVCALALTGLLLDRSPVSFAGGDDLIGSLPIMYPQESSTAPPPVVQPSLGDEGEAFIPISFVIEGEMRDVEGLVTDAYGVGFVQVEKTSKAEVFKYVFYGNVVINLDRRKLQYGNIKLSSRTGADYLCSKAMVMWDGQVVDYFKVGTTELKLPYDSLLKSGIADTGNLGLKFYKPKMDVGLLTFSAGPDFVRVSSVTL